MEPDYKALYFKLAEQVCLVQRIKAAAFDGQADAKRFWKAQSTLDELTGAALCWRDYPDLYGTVLTRKARRKTHESARSRSPSSPPGVDAHGAEV